MDYSELAGELLQNMGAIRREKSQKNIDESLHGEAFILGYIAYQNGHVNPGEIGQKMNVTTARIAMALNSLERKGLVSREIDPSNRRCILVSLTLKGRELAEDYQKKALKNITKMLEFLGEKDAQDYVRITKKLATFHLHLI